MVLNHPNRYGAYVRQPAIILNAEHRAQRKLFHQVRLLHLMPQVNYPNIAVVREREKLRKYKIAAGIKL